MKVIIAGGGTGGHLFPGIAVAEELTNRAISLKDDIYFIGTAHGIESRVIPKESYPLIFISSQGFVGKSFFKKIKAIISFIVGILDSIRILNRIKPKIVIGIGGYASVATVLTACFKGIPTIILEQNSTPGLANKILSRFVDAIAATYQDSLSYFPEHKTYLTGNPIRKHIIKSDKQTAYSVFSLKENRFTIFIFGGSAGANSINLAMSDALNYIGDLRHNIQFIHQTGSKDYEFIKEAYRHSGFYAFVSPFVYKMAEAYCVSDLVICRAGATTLAEITAVGKPAILIPYPYAAQNHQESNARKLADMGAAKIILDKDLNGQILSKMIRHLYSDQELRLEMQKMSSALGRVDAGDRIVNIILSLIRKD